MRRKILGFAAAFLLAVFGTAVLVAYVRGAEDRALAGEEVAEIYVVSKEIREGTPAEEIEGSVSLEKVQAKVRSADALDDLSDIEGQFAAITLLPGEQVVRSRFVDAPPSDSDQRPKFDIPAGKVGVTVRLSPERAFGGGLIAGQDKVAIIASFDPFSVELPELPDGSAATIEIDGSLFNGSETSTTTATIMRQVEVINVLPVDVEEPVVNAEGGEVVLAPPDDLLITLALDLAEAERLVFTAEFGTQGRENPRGGIWLALDSDEATDDGTQIWTRGNIYTPSNPATPVPEQTSETS